MYAPFCGYGLKRALFSSGCRFGKALPKFHFYLRPHFSEFFTLWRSEVNATKTDILTLPSRLFVRQRFCFRKNPYVRKKCLTKVRKNTFFTGVYPENSGTKNCPSSYELGTNVKRCRKIISTFLLKIYRRHTQVFFVAAEAVRKTCR